MSDHSSGRLINDLENVEAGDGSSILGGLPLRVIKVDRNSNHSVCDSIAEISFSSLLHFQEEISSGD